MFRVLSVLSLFLISFSVSASYKGRVYFDANKTGVYDSGDQLLENVAVTNGKDVVKTNKNGEFTLPDFKKARFITVTTPSGYSADGNYYISVSEGITTYDFALAKYGRNITADGSHSFIQISDTEIFNTENQERWANNVRDYSQSQNVAFVVHTGDICYDNGLRNHIKVMNNQNMGVPVYYVLGNHDLVKGDYGEQLFESIYGPSWYSFDYGNVHYIVTPMAGGDYKPSYTQADVYEWLKNDLANVAKDKPIICFNHDLISFTDKFIYKKNDKEQLDIGSYNLKAWLYGHWHNHFVRMQGKVKTISTATLDKGGIDHSTSAFRVVNVDSKGDVKTNLRYTFTSNHLELTSVCNNHPVIDSEGNIQLSVNAYHAGARVNAVKYQIVTDDKQVVASGSLSKNSDWNWSGKATVDSKFTGKNLFAVITAKCDDGTVVNKRYGFVNEAVVADVKITGDWVTLLGNSAHNGVVNQNINLPLHLKWVSNVGANIFMSSPIVYNGTLYVASVDEDLRGEGGIYAINPADGVVKWHFETRNSVKNTIAASNGNIFAQDAEGYLYAVDAVSGNLKWEKKLDINGLPVLDDGLTVSGGVVYAGSGKGFAAFDAVTGYVKWSNTGWRQGEGTTTTTTVADGVVINGTQWGGLHANDITDGKHLWSISKDGISNRGSSPSVHDGVAWFISARSLFAADVKSGELKVAHQLPYSVDVTSTPLVTDKLIIFGTVDNGVVALDRATFEQKWKVQTLTSLVFTAPYTTYPVRTVETSPVLIGNHVVFGASDGVIYLVNIENGRVEWSHSVGAPIFSTVAVSGNTIFVTDFGGNVYSFTTAQ